MAEPRCPICRKPVARRAENPSFPFCSPRCRLLDLGKWLGEDYRVPVAPPDGAADEGGEPPGGGGGEPE